MFKYTNDDSPPVERCVYGVNNRYSFELRTLPMPTPNQPVSSVYAEERARVNAEQKRLREKILAEGPANAALSAYREMRSDTIQTHRSIRSQYASYSAAKSAGDTMDAVTASLKPMRPPTAPASDIAREQSAIVHSSAPNMLLVQIALALVLISLLVYVFVPLQYAHSIVFLLMSVGIAVGIFLKK